MPKLPTLFVSHGSPMVMLQPETALHGFLSGLGKALPRPKSILCVTAHWTTDTPAVGTASTPEMIYDFYGFPDPLFAMTYSAPGAPDVGAAAAAALAAQGITANTNAQRGLDHGTWVPLKLMYPDADIPVTQLSVQPNQDGEWHLRLGEALAPLRDQGTLIIGSGSSTHNLRAMRRGATDVDPWAADFQDWLNTAVTTNARDDLAHYRTRAPHAEHAHPTDEHLTPLHVAAGASGIGTTNSTARVLHNGMEHGNLGTAAYLFE